MGGGEGGCVVGKDQLERVGGYCEGSVSHDDCEPMRGACRLNGSGSSLICADVVDVGRYGAGRGGTGGTDSRLPKGVAGLNQYDDLGAIDGYDAVTGCGSIRALALEGARECVLCVENENAEMLSHRELAREVIHDEPSLRASMSSVAKLGRGFSST